jgi:hypothetical protein
MRIMLCLTPGNHVTLERRREQAAGLMGVQPGTFRRTRGRGDSLLLDVAVEIYKNSA